MGLEVDEDDTTAETGADCGNLLARIPSRARGRADDPARARTWTRSPRRRRSSRCRRRAAGRTRTTAILGADNKAAVAVMLELARRASRRGLAGRPRAAVHDRRGGRAAGRQARSTPRRCRREFGYVFDHATPIGEIVIASPTLLPRRGRVPRQGRARRDPPGGRPLGDPRRRAARSPRCRSGRIDAETTANVG